MYVGIAKKNGMKLSELGAKQLGAGSRNDMLGVAERDGGFGRTFERKRQTPISKEPRFRHSGLDGPKRRIDKMERVGKSHNPKEAAKRATVNTEADEAAVEFKKAKSKNSNDLNRIVESSKSDKAEKSSENIGETVLKEDAKTEVEILSMMGLIDLFAQITDMMEDLISSNLGQLEGQTNFEGLIDLENILNDITEAFNGLNLGLDLGNLNFKNPDFGIEDFVAMRDLLEGAEEILEKTLTTLKGGGTGDATLNVAENADEVDFSKLNATMESLNVESSKVSVQDGKTKGENSNSDLQNVADEMIRDAEINRNRVTSKELKDETPGKNSFGREKTDEGIVNKQAYGQNSKTYIGDRTEFSSFQKAAMEDMLRDVQTTKTQISTFIKSNIFEQLKASIAKQSVKLADHSEMIIKLKPQELGRVELKIEVHMLLGEWEM